jgi:hypothetical protein
LENILDLRNKHLDNERIKIAIEELDFTPMEQNNRNQEKTIGTKLLLRKKRNKKGTN